MKNFRLAAILLYLVTTVGFINNYYAANTNTATENPQSSYLSKFKQDYEFLFIYSSSCGYCHKFAPVFRKFLDNNHLPVKAVTVNGGTLPSFTDAKYDANILNQYNLDGIPAVVIIKKSNGAASVFSIGSMSKAALDEKFSAYLNKVYGS